jgi:hypothetical protein
LFAAKKKLFKFASLLSKTKAKHDGAIAQLVEHRTENPGVAGSIPAGTTSRKAGFSRLFALKESGDYQACL